MVECPDCKGEGVILAFFACSSDGGCEPGRELPCLRCDGRKMVPHEQLEWIKAGKIMRDDRRSRHNTLRAEAAERGVRPSELCAMEQGRIEPVARIK